MRRQAEEDLFQVMAGALSVLSAAGCALVGGHTCEGADLALGVSVTVRVARDSLSSLRCPCCTCDVMAASPLA